jgi:nucleotide-binding universal stress UspA family protein
MVREAQAYLRGVADRVRQQAQERFAGKQVTVAWEAVWSPDVADTILAVAETGRSARAATQDEHGMTNLGRSDLIAMATHGHGGLQRWMVGSVADRVLHSTKQPILVVRPPKV